MKKLVLKLSLLPVLLFSVVSCRDDYHYDYTQEIDRQNTRDDGNFSFGNGFVSSDGEVLLKWLNKETTELDMENHPTLKNIKIIGEWIFGYININKVILPQSLEKIKQYAFTYTSLNSILIPNNVKKIERYAFYNSKLSDISILSNQLKEIETSAFRGNNLTSLEIPEGVEKIGGSAFSENNLNTIVLPSTMKTIGRDYYFRTDENKFSVNETGFYDFKTGEGGKLIKAVMTLENKSWKEAMDFLKDFSNTYIPEDIAEIKRIKENKSNETNSAPSITQITPPNNDKLIAYFNERGISKEVLESVKLSRNIYLNRSLQILFSLSQRHKKAPKVGAVAFRIKMLI